MNEVEKYLKKATRGLWGSKKREVREELATHIEGRVQAHRIGGLDEETAVQRTLSELGKPAQVSGGMLRLHAGPSLAGLGALLVLVCALTVTLVSSGLAQSLNVSEQLPTPACISGVRSTDDEFIGKLCNFYAGNNFYGGVWTTIEALEQVLEPQGVEVVANPDSLVLTFPEETRPVFIPGKYDLSYPIIEGYSLDELSAAFQVLPGYLMVWDVLDRIAASRDLPLEVEGWDNPKVRLGTVTFELGRAETVVQGGSFYTNYLVKVTEKLFQPEVLSIPLLPAAVFPSNKLHPHQFQLDGKPGDIYGVVSYSATTVEPCMIFPVEQGYCEGSEPFDTSFIIDVAPTAQDGSVTFHVPEADVASSYVTRFSNQPRAGETIIVRLTGKADRNGYGYEVVAPKQIGLER